jgi:hypothetical protein
MDGMKLVSGYGLQAVNRFALVDAPGDANLKPEVRSLF